MSLAAASTFACGERAERIWIKAARKVELLTEAVISSSSRSEQRIELAGFLERVKLVAAAHVRSSDKYLRGRGMPVRPLDHFGPPLTIAGHIDLGESDALAVQKFLGPIAIGAIRARVNDDVRHDEPLLKDRAV